MKMFFSSSSKKFASTQSSPLHPQSDGMEEQHFNWTLEDMLSKFVHSHQWDWDCHLPKLLMAYRSAVQKITGCTPAELMLGREVWLPVDLLFGVTGETIEELRVPRICQGTVGAAGWCALVARKHLQVESERQKHPYDHRHRMVATNQMIWSGTRKEPKPQTSKPLGRPLGGYKAGGASAFRSNHEARQSLSIMTDSSPMKE